MKAILCLFAVTALLASNLRVEASDIDILKFALNLEYLEANFYACAARGKPLGFKQRLGGPPPTGCTKALLGPEARKIAEEIARDELAHVLFLQKALGANAPMQPPIDIGVAFANAANAAVGATLSPNFTPYGDDLLFYLGAFLFEDVGVTAYKGAAPAIVDKAYLGAAAGIMAVEAYHAGFIRSKLIECAKTTIFPYGVDAGTIANLITSLRSVVGGGAESPLIAGNGTLEYVAADNNALAFDRNVSSVLNIVYLGGQNGGGFFPSGINTK